MYVFMCMSLNSFSVPQKKHKPGHRETDRQTDNLELHMMQFCVASGLRILHLTCLVSLLDAFDNTLTAYGLLRTQNVKRQKLIDCIRLAAAKQPLIVASCCS